MRLSKEINDILMANCETILLKKIFTKLHRFENQRVRNGDLLLGRTVSMETIKLF